MKKILLLLVTMLSLMADDIVVFNNEYKVLELPKKVTKLLVGNREMINVSLLSTSSSRTTTLKIFGKKSGNTSILIKYKDGSINNYHVYVNENLGFIQKMINIIEPTLELSKIGDGSTVITGTFKDPHNKKRIYKLLESAGIDTNSTMDLTETQQVNKMVRTKLYLVEINNQKAKDLGGVTGLGFFEEYLKLAINPTAVNGATFSGWLLDNTGALTAQQGTSVTATLNFLEESGIGTILDDTVLMTTEDENASFRVGGDVYIPIGMTQNLGFAPTIQLEEKQYGLFLTLRSNFMEKDKYLHINVDIEDSAFDSNKDHDVQLGEFIVVPSFVSKNIKTNVVVKSGQVIVLGGRLHTEELDHEEKIPFLGDIPLLGELFTHTVSGIKENDLLFFLVPEIIDANEDINDTNFYKEFKKSSSILHDQIMDLNDSEPQVKEENKESMVVLSEPELKSEEVVVTNVDDEVMIIEVEDHSTNNEESLSKEIVVEDKEVISAVIAPEAKKIEPIVVKDDTLPSKDEKKLSLPSSKQKYAVTSKKIFLRDKPSTGFRTNVWIKGHEFTVSEEKVVNGSTWFRVGENCYKGCTPESRELWISKKYVEAI